MSSPLQTLEIQVAGGKGLAFAYGVLQRIPMCIRNWELLTEERLFPSHQVLGGLTRKGQVVERCPLSVDGHHNFHQESCGHTKILKVRRRDWGGSLHPSLRAQLLSPSVRTSRFSGIVAQLQRSLEEAEYAEGGELH